MTTDNPTSSTPELLVPRAPLWLLSFAADRHPLSCGFVLVSDGFSFDDAWLRARAAVQVPPGRWDVVGWEVPETKRLELLALDPAGLIGELAPGQRLTEEQACRLFGPRSLWDWRAQDGARRRALLASLARVQQAVGLDPCDHDVEGTEECCVAHASGPCLACKKCLRWVPWEEQDAQRRPARGDVKRT